jgi:hypothetical protein
MWNGNTVLPRRKQTGRGRIKEYSFCVEIIMEKVAKE